MQCSMERGAACCESTGCVDHQYDSGYGGNEDESKVKKTISENDSGNERLSEPSLIDRAGEG